MRSYGRELAKSPLYEEAKKTEDAKTSYQWLSLKASVMNCSLFYYKLGLELSW